MSIPILTIDSRGNKLWKLPNDYLHKEDGPAIEYIDGTKCWCINGRLHREDGAAFECFDGSKFWYLNGKEYSEEEYRKITSKYIIRRPLCLKLKG